jgi:hypothetical protein
MWFTIVRSCRIHRIQVSWFKIDSSIKDLVLLARSEPLGSADKLTRSFE